MERTGQVLYRVNADGFRSRLYARPKPPGTFRILILGDSVAFGYGVKEDEAFPQVMEQRLADLGSDRVFEVINFGVGGYNPYNEAALFKDVGVTYSPDLVLVQFCINDLDDPTLHFDAHTRLHLGTIPDEAYPDPARRTTSFLGVPRSLYMCRRLRLCAMLDDAWLRLMAPAPNDLGPAVGVYSAGPLPDGSLQPAKSDRLLARQAAVKPVDGSGGPEWAWLEHRYADIEATAARTGAAFAIVAFPYPQQLVGTGTHPIQSRFAQLGSRHNWAIIDPLPAFRRAAASGKTLFIDWWHPTPAGHDLAASAILNALACRGCCPRVLTDSAHTASPQPCGSDARARATRSRRDGARVLYAEGVLNPSTPEHGDKWPHATARVESSGDTPPRQRLGQRGDTDARRKGSEVFGVE